MAASSGGIRKGLLPALKQYGENLGLKIREQVTGVRDLPRSRRSFVAHRPRSTEQCKHAGVKEATIYFTVNEKMYH